MIRFRQFELKSCRNGTKSKLKEIAKVKEEGESVPIVNVERVVNEVSPFGMGQEIDGKEIPGVLRTQGSDEILRNQPRREQALKGMPRKGNICEATWRAGGISEANRRKAAMELAPALARWANVCRRCLRWRRKEFQRAKRQRGELSGGVAVDGRYIYRASGIAGPRRGYRINKVVCTANTSRDRR
jgi:hypothetical protein